MTLPRAPIAHQGFFAAHFFTVAGSTAAVNFEDCSHKDTTDTIVQLFKAHASALITSCCRSLRICISNKT
jgi:hypothetical protein